MGTLTRNFIWVAAALLLSAPASADENVAFQIGTPENAVRLGTPFHIEMEASFPEGYSLHPDPNSANNEYLRTTAIKPGATQKRDGRIYQKFTFNITPFDLGVTSFPSVAWTLASEQGKLFSVRSPALPLEVLSYSDKISDPDKLRDIRPPWKPFNWLWLLLLLIPAAAFAARYYYLKKRRAKTAPKSGPAPDLRPPDIIAFEAIDRLVMGTLWQEGKYKGFYNELADILRDYLDRRTRITARNYNTADLCRRLNRTSIQKPVISAIRKFLIDCDMVKFAKHKPENTEKDSDIELMRMVIRQTTPPPQPPVSATAQGVKIQPASPAHRESDGNFGAKQPVQNERFK